MNRPLCQDFGCVPGENCVLILAALMLPYLVDVAYFGDLTPTHYAQENVIEETKVDLSDVQISLLYVDDQAESIETGITLQDAPTTCSSRVQTVFPRQSLLSTWHTSRPPPAILIFLSAPI